MNDSDNDDGVCVDATTACNNNTDACTANCDK